VLKGGEPDLRYMPLEAHRDWYAIVLGGSHRQQGMMPFGVASKVPAMPALNVPEADEIQPTSSIGLGQRINKRCDRAGNNQALEAGHRL